MESKLIQLKVSRFDAYQISLTSSQTDNAKQSKMIFYRIYNS